MCTANVCRSPFAELVLRGKLKGARATVSSGGTHACPGASADPTIMAIARDRGLGDLEHHRSKLFLPSLFAKFDLILCMEEMHMENVLREDFTQRGKVKLFGHWQRVEISDPTGRDREHYETCVEVIDAAAAIWVEKLRQMELV
nr:hypothetical protein [Trinickia violacea]